MFFSIFPRGNAYTTRLFFWFENSRVYINDAVAAALCEIDLKISIAANDAAVFDKIIDKTVSWNTTKFYNSKTHNCQHFIYDLLATIVGKDNVINSIPAAKFIGTFRFAYFFITKKKIYFLLSRRPFSIRNKHWIRKTSLL